MLEFLKKHKRGFIITLVAVCLTMIAVTAMLKLRVRFVENLLTGMTAPIQSGFTKAGNWVGERIEFFTGMSKLNDENQRLKNENALLTIENSRLKQVDEVNRALAELLETKLKYPDYPTAVGQVTGVEPGNWYNRFIIDLGTVDGIMKNMAVLADGALVGRIAEVWNRYARVESIINDTSAVSGISAKSGRTADVGVVMGDAALMMEGLCLMKFTSMDADVVVGDEICTSQLSSIYPPGITIGYVTEVIYDSKGMKTAVVEPVVNFLKIEYVLVITQLYNEE